MQLSQETNYEMLRSYIKEETIALRSFCDALKKKIKNVSDMQEDLLGDVDVAVGQSELLIRERFTQFATLIDDSELNRSEKEITLQDLQGFWDIIMIQVNDIKRKFDNIESTGEKKENPLVGKISNGSTIARSRKKVPIVISKPKSKTESSVGKTNIRSHILTLKREMKLKGNSNKDIIFATSEKDKENSFSSRDKTLKLNTSNKESELKIFDAGFFSVHSPIRSSKEIKKNSNTPAPITPPRVLSSSVLKKRFISSPMNHKDYSPCARITRSMKKRMEEFNIEKKSNL